MFRKNNLDDITDEEFDNIVCPFDDEMRSYVKNNILNQFIAHYIAEGYNKSAIWESNMDIMVGTAIETLFQFDKKDCNYKKIKQILKEKYQLDVINETPVQIKNLRT